MIFCWASYLSLLPYSNTLFLIECSMLTLTYNVETEISTFWYDNFLSKIPFILYTSITIFINLIYRGGRKWISIKSGCVRGEDEMWEAGFPCIHWFLVVNVTNAKPRHHNGRNRLKSILERSRTILDKCQLSFWKVVGYGTLKRRFTRNL